MTSVKPDKPYKPDFPYKGNQLILTSDRVTLHSRNDSIFIFGKQAVSLSSTKTINLDAVDSVKLYSPIIELGPNARAQGQPLILGRNLNQELINILTKLQQVGLLISQASESDIASTMQLIASAGDILNKEMPPIIQTIQTDFLLSKNTYTR